MTDAYQKGYAVIVAADGIASDDPQHALASRQWLEERAARFLASDAILAALDNGVAPETDSDVDGTLDATPLTVSRLEWEHIQRVLHENGGNVSATARALKMHRRTLQRKLMKRPAAQ